MEVHVLVYIKRVGLRGFKSFGPGRVVITLDKGFTAITGPNGSGKSNFVDAVRFVLGDLSARSLRTDKMAGIIFDGSPSTKASGAAHVYIQFDNNDRKIPVDVDTVTVSREVRNSGVSKYRLNGKLIHRSNLMDILSVAGLSFSEYNIIMQGMITKLADITPEERRNVIEDLVGIAEYNAKKAEAQSQLRQADINLRVASARIDEVQNRLESLERERNDALRYNYVQSEIKRLQAILISNKIIQLQNDNTDLRDSLQRKNTEIEYIKQKRSQIQLNRDKLELERRRFDEEVSDKGGAKLVEVQMSIGDTSAQIASLKTGIESNTSNLRGLTKIREERKQQMEILGHSIKDSTTNLGKRKRERDKLIKILENKTETQKKLSEKLSNLRENFENSTSKINAIEDELEKLNKNNIVLETQLEGNIAKHKVITNSIEDLEKRRDGFETTRKSLCEHLKELQELQKEEHTSLTKISETVSNVIHRKDVIVEEIDKAEKTCDEATNALVEFKAQKSLVERIASEDNALRIIEDMAKDEAISGVCGRLEDLIEVKAKYKKAIEAASAGWSKAIIVDELKTALKCIESLKKMKIGRIKLIPLKEVDASKVVESAPNINDVIDLAPNLIRYSEKYAPAINFVFGDTVITNGEKSAFLVSRGGYRAVDLNGDVYEAEGGIVSGYYRAPIRLSSIVPSEGAILGLDNNVKTLEVMISKRGDDIKTLEVEINKFTEEENHRTNIISMMVNEIDVVQQNVKRIKKSLNMLNRRVKNLRKEFDLGKEKKLFIEAEVSKAKERIRELITQRRLLRLNTKQLVISKHEKELEEGNTEVNELQRELVKAESSIAFLESNLETTLKPEFKRTKIELISIENQVSILEDKIVETQSALDLANKKLSELEESKEHLSKTISTSKDEKRRFELQLDMIDAEISKIDSLYLPTSNEAHRLEVEIAARNSDLKHLGEELKNLGHDEPLIVITDESKDADASLNLMNFELGRLGSVNLLAVDQYKVQQENYKQLSVRRNELAIEKKAILQFMDEIERQKKKTFMDAYNQINENFTDIFSKLTGGGKGWLKLQNLDDPFAGGLDIFVQFPGKSSRLVAGTSGGEKSVAAVSFIFSIQKMFPAPFYIFDEIEAHLDPSNVERLADLLKEQAFNTQFVVITLRDVVVDRADRLFGVYVQNGISKMISAKLAEALA